MNMPEVCESGSVPADDGTHLYYEVFGSGKTLLLCNGLLCQRSHWRHQVAYFAAKYQVVTFDYRGHNCSQFPQNDRHLTLEWCARDALSVLQSLQVDAAVLLGHSMGVPVAAKAALLSPAKVKAGVFICGTVTNPFESMFYSNRMNAVYRISDRIFDIAPGVITAFWKTLTRRGRLSYFLTSQLGFNPNLVEEKDVWLYLDGVNANRLETFYQLLKDYTRDEPIDWLEQVRCPVLLIAGEDDLVTPIHLLENMAKRLPDSSMEKIPGGSHNAHADLPAVVNRRIDRFLQEIGY